MKAAGNKKWLGVIFGVISLLFCFVWVNINGNAYLSDTSPLWISGYLMFPFAFLSLIMFALSSKGQKK